MIAIVEVGSKQYKVSENDSIYVEKIEGEEGSEIKLDKVLLVDEKIGTPYLKDAYITAKIEKQGKQPKILIIHHRSQKHHTKKQGHRQPYTKLSISKINI